MILRLACASAVVLAAVASSGCRPASQASADTALADTVSTAAPAAADQIVDTVPQTTVTKKSRTPNRSSGSSRQNGNATPRDTGILGYDSVIRFPRRWPTASSTPTRK